MGTNCQVLGCEAVGTTGHHEDRANFDYWVCEVHSLALRAGEPRYYDQNTRELRVGPDAPLELIGLTTSLSRGNAGEIVTITLGRDGLATETVEFQIDSDRLRTLAKSLAGG